MKWALCQAFQLGGNLLSAVFLKTFSALLLPILLLLVKLEWSWVSWLLNSSQRGLALSEHRVKPSSGKEGSSWVRREQPHPADPGRSGWKMGREGDEMGREMSQPCQPHPRSGWDQLHTTSHTDAPLPLSFLEYKKNSVR